MDGAWGRVCDHVSNSFYGDGEKFFPMVVSTKERVVRYSYKERENYVSKRKSGAAVFVF